MKSIESTITIKSDPKKVWKLWKQAKPWNQWDQDFSSIQANTKGHIVSKHGKAVPYKILDVQEGRSFTVAWKALFLRLIFTYQVEPVNSGSKITYLVQIKGFFSWPIRFILRKKIQKNLDQGLKSFASQI